MAKKIELSVLDPSQLSREDIFPPADNMNELWNDNERGAVEEQLFTLPSSGTLQV